MAPASGPHVRPWRPPDAPVTRWPCELADDTSPLVVMTRTRGATGLFSPDSVTWRVHAEPLMGLAGMRALLLQALHPAAMAAIDEHSNYSDDPWSRLTRTTEFVGVATFGTATEAMFAGSRVRAVHARIRGTTPDGAPYSADDPQLLAWVHSCMVASFLEVTTRAGLRLSPAEQDSYIAEQVNSAMLVGLEPDEVPRDRAGLLDYFAAVRPVLECSPAARRAAKQVINPVPQHLLPTPVAAFTGPMGRVRQPRPAWAVVAGLAYAALPPWARRIYAIGDLPGPAGLADAATTLGLKALRATLR